LYKLYLNPEAALETGQIVVHPSKIRAIRAIRGQRKRREFTTDYTDSTDAKKMNLDSPLELV